jgi:DNA-binding transcriptional MerR regulator
MAKRKLRPEKLYGTKQVAEFLGIPDWRVKNFSEGKTYGLAPTQTLGRGHGSRRLYGEADIYRLAIASELVNLGFGPEVVRHALSKISDSELVGVEGKLPEDMPILVCEGGLWRIRRREEVHSLVERTLAYLGEEFGVFILNFPNVLEPVYQRMQANSDEEAK